MNVPTPLDFILMVLWPAALFVAVWGIIIGRRQDRLAKVVGRLYGILGLAFQTPMVAAWLGLLGTGYNNVDAITWLFGCLPSGLSLTALGLGFQRPKSA